MPFFDLKIQTKKNNFSNCKTVYAKKKVENIISKKNRQKKSRNAKKKVAKKACGVYNIYYMRTP